MKSERKKCSYCLRTVAISRAKKLRPHNQPIHGEPRCPASGTNAFLPLFLEVSDE